MLNDATSRAGGKHFPSRIVRSIWDLLPHGEGLPEAIWAKRHKTFLLVLWLHVIGLPLLGWMWERALLESLSAGLVIGIFTLLAGMDTFNRRVRAALVSLGFASASGLLVHLSGGYIEMHFHYFVVVTFLTLYQDWIPFLVCIVFVGLQHGLIGYGLPIRVYNHPDALAHPWKWATIHTLFIGSASIGCLVAWRNIERGVKALHQAHEELEHRVEARTAELKLAVALLQEKITERKRAEEALRENEQQMRLFMLATNDSTWNWDMVACSVTRSGFDRAFGYPAEEVVPSIEWWEDRLHPDDRERVLSAFRDAVARGGVACSYEYRFRRRDGSYAVINDRAYIVRDHAGTPVRALGTMTDITERKRTQEALQEREERLRAILDHEPECVKLVSPEGCLLEMNPAGLAMIEADTAAQVIGKPVLGLVHPDDQQEYERLQHAVCDGQEATLQFRIIGLRGGQRWVDTHAVPLRDAHGNISAVLSVTRDITARKRVEAALQESEARNRAILESAHDGIITINQEGRILEFNPAAEAMFGHRRDTAIGQEMAALIIPPSLRKEHRAGLARYLATGITSIIGKQIELVAMRADGAEFPIELTVTRIGQEGTPLFTAFIRDLTRQKQAEAERLDLYERLQESHKGLHTLSQRLLEAQELERRRIARELHDETGQTLTSLLIGMRALEEMSMRDAVRKRVSELRKTAARSINEIKRLALGLHPNVLDDLGLETALRRLTEEFVHAHGLVVDLHLNGLDGSRLPLAVETVLYRIAQEALTNVVKHAGGARVSILLQCSPSTAKVIIEDDGRGFDVQAVFKAAGRLNRMGLHGMRERAALLNGSIEIESTQGGGTTIYAHIPIGRGAS